MQKLAGAGMLVSNQIQEVFIMMTYKKVLEVFADYLTEDDSCEVLTVSREVTQSLSLFLLLQSTTR